MKYMRRFWGVERIFKLGGMAALGAALLLPEARASSSFYYELQGGLGQMRAPAPFFGADAVSGGYSPSMNLSFAYSISGGEIPAEFQFGLQGRYSTASVSGGMTYYGLLAPYPILRIQLSRIFVTVGATPFLWRRIAPTAGFTSLDAVSGSIALLGEGGFLWAVAPTFSIGAALGAQYITTSGSLSPKPILEATLVMRVYFGFSKGGGGSSSSSSSNEFKGWRYPFGNSLAD